MLLALARWRHPRLLRQLQLRALANDVDKRLAELRAQVSVLREQYYNQGAADVSDLEFDALVAELDQLEQAHPGLASVSHEVGAGITDTSSRPRVQHAHKMLSLDHTYSEHRLAGFAMRVQRAAQRLAPSSDQAVPLPVLVAELKWDGVALSVRYDAQGQVACVATRGDGIVGLDVTSSVLALVPPACLPRCFLPDHEVRGELVLPHAAFSVLNDHRRRQGLAPAVSARHAVVGVLARSADAVVAAGEPGFAFHAYQLVLPGGDGSGDGSGGDEVARLSHTQAMQMLDAAGFYTGSEYRMCFQDIDELIEALHQRYLPRRASLHTDCDGVVIKTDDPSLSRHLGASQRAPAWAIAFKFPPVGAATRILAIDWQVGRTGRACPVARLDPVLLDGVRIANATLSSYARLCEMRVAAGAIVIVQRAGDVIPHIAALAEPAPQPPDDAIRLPACQCDVVPPRTFVPHGRHVMCVHAACPQQAQRRLQHFVARDAMDISALGPQSLRDLTQLGVLRHPLDLYRLHEHRAKLAQAPGWAEVRVARLLSSIDGSRNRLADLGTLLHALGVPGLGRQASHAVAAALPSLDAVLAASASDLPCRPADVEAVYASLHRNGFLADVKARLDALGIHPVCAVNDRQPGLDKPLAHQHVVVTGRFPEIGRRATVTSRIQSQLGAAVSSRVTARTSIVFAGDGAVASKLDAAGQRGARVLSQADLLDMLGESSSSAGSDV